MLQLVYISTATGSPAVTSILAVSRRNNARDQVTGLLYADGVRFLQALEGPGAMVEAAFARIQQDARHRALVVLSRRSVEQREFGDWVMAHREPGSATEPLLARIAPLLTDTSPAIRATFESFAQVRRAA